LIPEPTPRQSENYFKKKRKDKIIPTQMGQYPDSMMERSGLDAPDRVFYPQRESRSKAKRLTINEN